MDGREIFNDGVLKATLLKGNWLWIEWLTNKVGYLSKTVVKDLYLMEEAVYDNGWAGLAMASEQENTDMHKLIEKFGFRYKRDIKEYKLFVKEVNNVWN